MTGTEGRAYRREDLEAAEAAWSDFTDPIWRHVRAIAARRGMLYPPAGTAWDQRDDPKPSQRAIVYAALVDLPRRTARIVEQSRSWREVVERILRAEAALDRLAAAAEARGEPPGIPRDPSPERAAAILESITGRRTN